MCVIYSKITNNGGKFATLLPPDDNNLLAEIPKIKNETISLNLGYNNIKKLKNLPEKLERIRFSGCPIKDISELWKRNMKVICIRDIHKHKNLMNELNIYCKIVNCELYLNGIRIL